MGSTTSLRDTAWAMSQRTSNGRATRSTPTVAAITSRRRGGFAPDVVWEVGQELPAHGPAAVRELWKRWDSEWDELETVADEILTPATRSSSPSATEAEGEAAGSSTATDCSRCTLSRRPVRQQGRSCEPSRGPRSSWAVGIREATLLADTRTALPSRRDPTGAATVPRVSTDRVRRGTAELTRTSTRDAFASETSTATVTRGSVIATFEFRPRRFASTLHGSDTVE